MSDETAEKAITSPVTAETKSPVESEPVTQKAKAKKRPHAIALFSGGLDSALAILLLLKQDIEVTALTFMTHFGCDASSDRSSCGSNPYPMADKFGFNVKLMHLGQKFVDIVVDPKHGRGKHMNVCIDCRMLMINEAARCMRMMNADFLVTGEVMGQRPMSQRKPIMELVDKETDLGGRLLRPLSAKLLPPTLPEQMGMVDREQLEGISGRSRKRQMELAKEFGLDEYPTPASGCLLTDANYSRRLRDLLAHSGTINFTDLNLLRLGRQFRISPECKLLLGRDENDNKALMQYRNKEVYVLEARETSTPFGLLYGSPSEEDLRFAASTVARYCDQRDLPEVNVTIVRDGVERVLRVAPANEDALSKVRL